MNNASKNWSDRIQNAVALLKAGNQIAYHTTTSAEKILREGFVSKSGVYWFANCSNISMGEDFEEILKVSIRSENPYIWIENDPEPDDAEFIKNIKNKKFDAILAPSNIALMDFVILKKENIKILGKIKD